MKFNELNKGELDEVVDAWLGFKIYTKDLVTLEEFCEHYVKRCEQCNRIVILDYDESLDEGLCEDCYKDIIKNKVDYSRDDERDELQWELYRDTVLVGGEERGN